MQISNILEFDLGAIMLAVSSVMTIFAALKIALSDNLLDNIICMSVFSLFISLCYLLMDAPDVAMTEVAIGACLSTIILLIMVKKFYPNNESSFYRSELQMKPHSNKWAIFIALCLCVIFISTLTYIGLEIPLYGDASSPVNTHISKYYLENTANDIGIPSVVAAVLASYRGYDTLGETSVILIAGLSIILILSKTDNKGNDNANS